MVEPPWRGFFGPRKNAKIYNFGHFRKPKSPNAPCIPHVSLYYVIMCTSRIEKRLLDPWNTLGVMRYPVLKMQFSENSDCSKCEYRLTPQLWGKNQKLKIFLKHSSNGFRKKIHGIYHQFHKKNI